MDDSIPGLSLSRRGAAVAHPHLMYQHSHKIPGLDHNCHIPDKGRVPGLSLSRRDVAAKDFMDQHSREIPCLGQGRHTPDDSIPGLYLFPPTDPVNHGRQGSYSPDTDDSIPGLSLCRRGVAPPEVADRGCNRIPGPVQGHHTLDSILGLSLSRKSVVPTDFPGLLQGLNLSCGLNYSGQEEKDLVDQRSQQAPSLKHYPGGTAHPDETPHLHSETSQSSTLEEIWRTEMLISEEELRHAINVLTAQPSEDIEAFGCIHKYIFNVVLPHASKSREIYHKCGSWLGWLICTYSDS